MPPLHDLAVGIRDGTAIAELILTNKGTATEIAATFRPGTLTVL